MTGSKKSFVPIAIAFITLGCILIFCAIIGFTNDSQLMKEAGSISDFRSWYNLAKALNPDYLTFQDHLTYNSVIFTTFGIISVLTGSVLFALGKKRV